MSAGDSSSGGEGRPRFYGKYRGTVMINIDPLQIGRIIAPERLKGDQWITA